jgi:hypothetical protein
MCHLQSSSGGTTTWTEQAIHPEARKVSSGPPFRQYLVQKYRYWYAKDPVRWYAWRRGGNISKLSESIPLRWTKVSGLDRLGECEEQATCVG